MHCHIIIPILHYNYYSHNNGVLDAVQSILVVLVSYIEYYKKN